MVASEGESESKMTADRAVDFAGCCTVVSGLLAQCDFS